MPPKGKVAAKVVKKAADSIIHPPYLKTIIPAGQAVAAPPLGPQLGQRGIQIGQFCKQFNDLTNKIKPGTPVTAMIVLNPDRTIGITVQKPPTSYLLKLAAGARKGGIEKDDVAGKVTLKHIYEIAKIKIDDPAFRGRTLEDVCKQVIGTAHSVGIQVVKSLDPEEYGQFLKEREEKLQEFETRLEDARKSKLLRL